MGNLTLPKAVLSTVKMFAVPPAPGSGGPKIGLLFLQNDTTSENNEIHSSSQYNHFDVSI